MPKKIDIYPVLGFSPLGGSNDFGIKLLGGIDVPTRQRNMKINVHVSILQAD